MQENQSHHVIAIKGADKITDCYVQAENNRAYLLGRYSS